MRGAVITEHGGLEVVTVVDDLPIPEPNKDQVRVKIHAAALNRLDLWVREGWPGLDLHMPHVMCADGAGVVDAVGENVTNYTPGDHVCIDPTIISADDPAMMTGMENQGRLAILGEHVPGMASEYALVPARNLLKMPEHISFEDAAAVGLVYLTAWHSLITRGGLTIGEEVLIVGAGGGVNTASIQIAKLAGAKVYVVGSNAEKCAGAQELGADVVLNREEDLNWSKAMYKLTQKRGVDIVVDNVGAATLKDSIRSTRIGGRLLIVGATSGPKTELDIRHIFTRQISIIGSMMGPHQDYVKVMNLVFEGKLKPIISEVLPLDEARTAQEKLQNFETFGKLVLKVTDEAG